MPDDEIKKKMEEAEQFSEKDKKEFELAQANNEAESLIYITDKTITELKDKLSKDQFDKISETKKKLQDAVTSKDVGRIRTETENLKKVLQEIGASAYQQAGPEMKTPPPGEDKGYEQIKKKKKDDTVVEGEYEKVDDDKK